MPVSQQQRSVPVSEAALRLRMTRDRVVRLIQRGELAGGQVAGRFWFVDANALDHMVAAKGDAARRSA